MLEALLQGLLAVLQVKAFSFMLLGILVGFWVGLLPGLGGATTLALMLPFIYNMPPAVGGRPPPRLFRPFFYNRRRVGAFPSLRGMLPKKEGNPLDRLHVVDE